LHRAKRVGAPIVSTNYVNHAASLDAGKDRLLLYQIMFPFPEEYRRENVRREGQVAQSPQLVEASSHFFGGPLFG
jgi:hypothetical protein